MRIFALLLTLSIACVGCQSMNSLNIQRSAIRGGGDMAATAAIESADTGNALALKAEVSNAASAIRAFIKTGSVSTLTTPELKARLYAVVPAKYAYLVDLAVSGVQGANVNTQAIGADNIKRIDAFCVGVINGCNEYSLSDKFVAK